MIRGTRKYVSVIATVLIILSIRTHSYGQVGGGYIVAGKVALPDTALLTNSFPLYFSPNKEDVKSIGMGRIGIAGISGSTLMLYNPASLARSAFRLDLLNVSASLPSNTFSAAKFIKNNLSQFQRGDFLNLLKEGYRDFDNAVTPQQKLNAIRKINSAMIFPNNLIHEVVGSEESPRVHGMSVLPSFQLQVGNIGVSVFSQVQLGFSARPGESISKLAALVIPENAENLTGETIRTIAEVVNTLFDSQGNLSPSGLPQVTAMTFVDIAGAVGYGRDLGNNLSVGASLKIVNRRFSVKNIDAVNLDNIFNESGKELQVSATGFTFDAGGVYSFRELRTKVAIVLQNIIPMKTISSTANFNFALTQNVIPTDNAGNPYVGFVDTQGNFIQDPAGDTAVVVVGRKVNVGVPFELKAPFLCTIGATRAMDRNWDAGLEIADLFANDTKYNGFTDRIRIGTEYRLFSDIVALRIGFAAKNITYGFGFNFKIVQIDAASAQDTFIGDRSYFAQLKVGW